MAYSLEEMEAYLSEIYSAAAKDLEKTARQYLKDFERLQKQNQKKVDNGKWTQEEYDTWRKNKLLYGEHWPRIIQKVQREMLKVNQTALDYVNGKVPQIFAHTYNEVANKIPKSPVSGYSFELVNSETVNKLVKEEGIMLPPKKNLDKQKDKLWNAKQLNAQILQGVLTGESIPKLAERVKVVVGNNEVAAVRTARTMCTAAENSGRQSAYNKAEADGIKLNKTWLSAYMQANTRDTHRELNEQTVRSNEMFLTFKGNELEFPGDWRAPGYEVYNCRCTMVTSVIGFDKDKLKESVERQKKEREEAQSAEQESNSNQNIEIETQNTMSREEQMTMIENAFSNANIDWQNCPDEVREMIISAAQNCPEYLSVIISDTLPRANIVFIDGAGTSCYDPYTGIITIYLGDESSQELVNSFWHEYGHFVDDAITSHSGFKNVEIFEKRGKFLLDDEGNYIRDKDGNRIRGENTKEEFVIKGITPMFAVNGGTFNERYQEAVVSDVNAFLERTGLSDKYIMRVGEDKYTSQWLFRTDGTSVDTTITDNELMTAFRNECRRISGEDKLATWMQDNYNFPKEVIYEDYYESYVTPKRQEVKFKEKYKGAGDDYRKAMAERSEAVDKFFETHDSDKINKEYEEYREKTENNMKMLGGASDTFDAGAFGAFASQFMGAGGHTAEYYMNDNRGIKETVANIFSAEVTQNQEVIDYMKELNPNVYALYSEVLKNGRN